MGWGCGLEPRCSALSRDTSGIVPGTHLQLVGIQGQEGVHVHVYGNASFGQVFQVLCWSSTLKKAYGAPRHVLPMLLEGFWGLLGLSLVWPNPRGRGRGIQPPLPWEGG